MAEQRPLTAEDVARRQFATGFRGFEQHEVRAFLGQVATELASLQERERSLRERLAAVEAREPAAPAHLDDAAMEAALGAETTRVIHAAREAAAEIRQRAEESVSRMLREANAEVARLKHEAETVLSERTAEAEEAASAIRADAERHAEELVAAAEASAASTVEEAQRQGKEMVAEAQAVRQRMLGDLAKRRTKAVSQLESLRAGRERLLQAYEIVRTTLEQVTTELTVADAEAKLAAEAAALRSAPELEPLDLPEPDVAAAPDAEPEEEPPTAVDAPAAAATPAETAPPDSTPPVLAVVRAREAAAGSDGGDPRSGRAEPEPEPEPAVARARPVAPQRTVEPVEERRSSALRLLRRKQEDAPVVLPIEDDVESVRIIRAAPDPSPAPDVDSTPEPRVLRQPEPVAEPSAEPEPAPSAEAEVLGGVEPTSEAAAVEDEEAVTPERPVDDLFARLRADRAAAVEQAEAVLASTDDPPADDAPAEVEPTAQVEAVADVAAEPEPEQGGDGVFEARDAAVEATERALTRALKRALADEQNEVLDALRRSKGRPAAEALLPPVDEQTARYVAAVAEHLAAGACAGAAASGGEAGADADELATAVAGEVAADLRGRVERSIDDAGGDVETLQEAISAAYREWKTARVEPLARHAIAGAYAAGAFAAAPDGPLTWVVDPAEGGCPDCDDNALAGPTPKGESFPTGQPHPPAHAGCRCLIVPAR